MEAERQGALLKEYEMCHVAVQHQNTIAWTIGGIFIAGTIAAFGWVSSQPKGVAGDWYHLVGVVVAGLGSILVLCFWYRAYRRWGFFVEVAEYRMREIEQELGLWKNRYVDFLDSYQRGHLETKKPAPSEGRIDKLMSWAERPKETSKLRFERVSVHKWILGIVLSLKAAWVLLMIRQFLVFLAII